MTDARGRTDDRIVADTPAAFVACRTLGHVWPRNPTSVNGSRTSVTLEFECECCGTTRVQQCAYVVRADGVRTCVVRKCRYGYPEGYLNQGAYVARAVYRASFTKRLSRR